MRIAKRHLAVLAVGASALHGPAMAQSGYPERPVEVIVPFNAGGGADSSQRLFNKYAEQVVGETMVVVNKPGAGGTRGWAEALHANTDGYTLSLATPPFNIIPALAKPDETGYQLDQFEYLCIYAAVPDVFVVRADSQFETLDDLVAHAKENPGKVTAGNTGMLGADFMTTLMIEDKAGIDLTQVPFTGGSQALQATLSGTVDAMVASAIFAVAQEGNVRTLAIASDGRDPSIPDIPTFSELGYDIVSERYRALAAPAGTPEEVVAYWADVCQQVTEDSDFQAEMTEVGQPVAYHGPDRADELIGALTDEMQGLVDRYELGK